jgi:citronellol/citronellal dehydrogenase
VRSCSGKVAVVTGASRGIGQAIARRLGAEGAMVVALGRTATEGSGRFAGSLEETVHLIETDGGSAFAVRADLNDIHDLARVIPACREQYGQDPQILVNNAAARRHFDITFPIMKQDVFLEAIGVNLWAPWKLAIDAIPGMIHSGGGWIINISSRGAAPIPGPPFECKRVGAQALYGTTKAAIDRLTTAAAMELYDDGIAVNSLAPTLPVLTENARIEAGIDETMTTEPVDTVAEAVLALSTSDQRVLTGRVAYSLPLLVELNRPVHRLDGKTLLAGWQPNEIDPSLLWTGYLIEPRPTR